jgi:hypothetical protein
LALHGQTVEIYRQHRKGKVKGENRTVHLLDMFGYYYTRNGGPVDVHDPPKGVSRRNVGSEERPVWRLRRRKGDQEVDERPAGVLFRLNKELAEEIAASKNTIGFTLIARRVFAVLRRFHRDHAAIRLVLLPLRQRNQTFQRRLGRLLGDLGWDTAHPERALERLEASLAAMQEIGLIEGFAIDQRQGRLEVIRSDAWFREEPQA